MLTLYELKQNSCFRCFYKSPYYIKNLFLMAVMSVMLFIIYVVYFRADGGNILNIMNILKGLNSNTFNYLESQKSLIGLDDEITKVTKFDMTNPEEEKMTTQKFYSECVRLNKPCAFKGMANDWPATTKWAGDQGGREYLKGLFKKDQLAVYTSTAKDKTGVSSRTHSF